MKTLVWVASVMALGTVAGMAQPPEPPPAAAAATNGIGPKIQFASLVHDFGRARSGESIHYTYTFTNTGDATLIIKSVQPQCGCTAAGEWTRQVEPGQAGRIPIQFNTHGYNGPVFKQTTVNCNVADQPAIFLQIKGTVYRPIEFTPPMTVLNISPDEDVVSALVTITNNTDEPLALTAPESNNRIFAAELKTNVPGKGYQLTVTTVPPLPMGNVQGQISLRTGWTNPMAISFPVVANVQPAVLAIPSYMTLAPGPLEKAVTNSISVRNQSTNAVRLSDPAVSLPGPRAEIQEMQPGKAFTVMVAFPEGFAVPPNQPVELTFKTSHPRYPVMKVPIMQMPRPAAVPPPTPPPPPPPPASGPAPLPPLPSLSPPPQ